MKKEHRCANCGRNPQQTKFSKDKRESSGLQSWCNECKTESDKLSKYSKNKHGKEMNPDFEGITDEHFDGKRLRNMNNQLRECGFANLISVAMAFGVPLEYMFNSSVSIQAFEEAENESYD
jgi:hypothetical protein